MVGAPHQCPLEVGSKLPLPLYADVRAFQCFLAMAGTPDGRGPPFVRTVSSITAAAMVVQNFDEAAEMARVTGRVAAAEAFDAMLPSLRKQYHDSFFDPVGNIYGDGTPTAFATALWLGVTPPALLPTVVENFVTQLRSVGFKMNTIGFIGVRDNSVPPPLLLSRVNPRWPLMGELRLPPQKKQGRRSTPLVSTLVRLHSTIITGVC